MVTVDIKILSELRLRENKVFSQPQLFSRTISRSSLAHRLVEEIISHFRSLFCAYYFLVKFTKLRGEKWGIVVDLTYNVVKEDISRVNGRIYTHY